jgi:CheY-like chemotaxis protein
VAVAGRARVLVVDDDVDSADILAEALADVGYLVEVAYDAPTALAKLEVFTADVALLDLDLPRMNGYELARRIRAQASLAGIRLLAVTGRAEPRARLRAREAGFEGHLVKPLDLESIERAIEAPSGPHA